VHASTKGIEDGVLGGVPYSQDEWETEFVLILGVEGVEVIHLLLGQSVQPRACLLAFALFGDL
jgi:hypothetical protein